MTDSTIAAAAGPQPSPTPIRDAIRRKTWKREIAFLMLLCEAWLGYHWALGSQTAGNAAEFFAPFVFPFAAAAYGADFVTKQLLNKKGTDQ